MENWTDIDYQKRVDQTNKRRQKEAFLSCTAILGNLSEKNLKIVLEQINEVFKK